MTRTLDTDNQQLIPLLALILILFLYIFFPQKELFAVTKMYLTCQLSVGYTEVDKAHVYVLTVIIIITEPVWSSVQSTVNREHSYLLRHPGKAAQNG